MNATQNDPLISTPRSKTKFMLKKCGKNLSRNTVAYRRLVLGNALINSMKSHTGKKSQNIACITEQGH